MTREDERLNRIEAGLGPQELVYLWLEEAQRFPSLPAYAGWLSTQPDEVYPLIRLPAWPKRGCGRGLERNSRPWSRRPCGKPTGMSSSFSTS